MGIESVNLKEKQSDLLYKNFGDDVLAALKEVPNEAGLEEKKRHLLDSIKTSDIYRSNQEILEPLRQELKNTNFQTETGLAEAVTRTIVEFLKNRFSPEELEQLLRGYQTEYYGRKEINRLLTYDIKGDELHIHIPLTFEEDPNELKALFIQGLKLISKELRENEKLAHIQSVRGDSWIVPKVPRLLKSLGFTIISSDPETGSGVTEISKEKLLELYS